MSGGGKAGLRRKREKLVEKFEEFVETLPNEEKAILLKFLRTCAQDGRLREHLNKLLMGAIKPFAPSEKIVSLVSESTYNSRLPPPIINKVQKTTTRIVLESCYLCSDFYLIGMMAVKYDDLYDSGRW